MALYGFLVSAPLSHFLVGALQKAFQGKTDLRAKIGQIVASNLLVAPVQVSGEFQELTLKPHAKPFPSAYLASIAVINGSKSLKDVINTVKAGFGSVIRVRVFDICVP